VIAVGMLRTLYKDPSTATYFERFGRKSTLWGDGAKRDGEGYYTITGRVDDVMNVSGHRVSLVRGQYAGGQPRGG